MTQNLTQPISTTMSKEITRREAIRQMAIAGAGIAAAGTILESCTGSGSSSSPKTATLKGAAPEGTKVTTRKWDSLSGESISLLGLGCMRLPNKVGGRGLDQDQVNEMVDYSLAHGINYFDTTPAYGQSV